MDIQQEQNPMKPNFKKYILWNLLFLLSLAFLLSIGRVFGEGLNRILLSLSEGSSTGNLVQKVLTGSLDYWLLFILLPSVLIYQAQRYFGLRIGKKIFSKLIISAIGLSFVAIVLITIIVFVLTRPTGHSAGFAILYLPFTFFYILIGYSIFSLFVSFLVYRSETSNSLRSFLAWIGKKAYIFGCIAILLVAVFSGFIIFSSQTCFSSGGSPDGQAICYSDIALGKNDPSECQNAIKKDLCLVYLSQEIDLSAVHEDGSTFCGRISNAGDQIACLENVGYFSRENSSDRSCDKLTLELPRNWCYYLQADSAKFSARELCDKITDKPIGDDRFLQGKINSKSIKEACLREFEMNNSSR